MIKLLTLLSFTIFCSCNYFSNHFADGVYTANVFNNSMTWVTKQQVEINGSEMNIKIISIVDSSILNEFKTKCVQFTDRIEFQGKDGVTMVARITENGDLKYAEYTYKKRR